MRPWSKVPRRLCLLLLAALALASGPAGGQTPKRGGILNAMLAEDPPGFSIHESSTISGVWPLSPCYSNLVLFDPLKPQESAETVIPELAERWSWQDNYRNLVFFLRKNVRWHDGQPFSAKDLKYTFDVVREARDASAKLRLSPRKDWYENVEAIETPDSQTVIFRLKRAQPSLVVTEIAENGSDTSCSTTRSRRSITSRSAARSALPWTATGSCRACARAAPSSAPR